MIGEGYMRRHEIAFGVKRDVALLDVAQEYILEYMRRQGLFDDLVFKGGTALRKFAFGPEGRFSTDLDFGLTADEPGYADLVLDSLDGAELFGIRVTLQRRQGTAAQLQIGTSFGPVAVPAAISIRTQAPWLPPVKLTPIAFEYLDRGLAAEFQRAALPVLDLREIAAEKIAAFWRRRKARDLYDLEHLGRLMQSSFDGTTIARLAALKIYFDVVDEGLGRAPPSTEAIFGCGTGEVEGISDLGYFRASTTNVDLLLGQCAQRYAALTGLDDELVRVVVGCNHRDRHRALILRQSIVVSLEATRGG